MSTVDIAFATPGRVKPLPHLKRVKRAQRKVGVPRPTTMAGVQLLPSDVVVFSPEGAGRGWGQTVVCAGRSRVSRGYITYATANFLRLPDFCGAMLVGCVRIGNKLIDPANAQHMALPEIDPVPAEIWSVFPRTAANFGLDGIYPLIGIWHHLLTATHLHQGAALLQVADRVAGVTMQRSLEAVKFLQGRNLCHELNASNHDRATTQLQSYRLLKPYMNYNSGSNVTELLVRVKRVFNGPDLWGPDRLCKLPTQPRMASLRTTDIYGGQTGAMTSPISISTAPPPP